MIPVPYQHFIDPTATRLKAVDNGFIYLGAQDTDPTVPANQLPVFYIDENGNTIQVPQPILLNGSGVPCLKNGTVYNPQVSTQYASITLQNKRGVAVYEHKSWPVLNQYRTDLASSMGFVYAGEWYAGILIPDKAMTDKLAYWHNGQFYSVGTDTGFTSNDFDADLGKGFFVDESINANILQSAFIPVEKLGMSSTNTDVENYTAWEAIRADGYKNLLFKSVDYNIKRFDTIDGMNLMMISGGRIVLSDGIAPQANIRSNVTAVNLHIHCTQTDMQWNRCALDNRTDVRLVDCKFTGFLNPTNRNSWGLLLSGNKRIKIDNCGFAHNTQSDIALTDDNEDIEIIYPYIDRTLDAGSGGVHVNLEPNIDKPNSRITIRGGEYRELSLLTNSNTSQTVNQVSVSEAHIRVLWWHGANVAFRNCEVDIIRTKEDSSYGGIVSARNTRGLSLSPNLLSDAYVMQLTESRTLKESYWYSGYSTAPFESAFKLKVTSNGSRFVVMNPDKTPQTPVNIISENFGVQYANTLCLAVTGLLDTETTGSGEISQQYYLTYYSSDGATVVGNQEVKLFMQVAGEDEPSQTMCAFIVPPAGAIFASLNIKTSTFYNNSLWIKAVSVHAIEAGGNVFDEIIQEIHNASNRTSNVKTLHGTVGNKELAMVRGDEFIFNNERYRVKSDKDTTPPVYNKYTMGGDA